VNANASTLSRSAVPLQMFLRDYLRTPLNLVLLLVIPALLILAFGDALNRLAGIFDVLLTAGMGQSMGAMWAAAFLTAISGFFMMVSARDADRRLVRSGYPTAHVVALRFAAVALLAALATAASYAVLLTQLTPDDHVQSLLVIYLGALVYGTLGILVGSLIPGQLEGSFALLFFFVMDAFIGSPLFGDAPEFPFGLLPTYFPTKILLYVTAQQPHDAVHWLYVALYLAATTTLAGLAFYRAARVR